MPVVAGRQSRLTAMPEAPGTETSIRMRPSVGSKVIRSGSERAVSCTTPL